MIPECSTPGNLEWLNRYKETIIGKLLTNENIVALLKDGCKVEDAKDLMYKNVFPVWYIPDTAQKGYTYMCIDADVRRVNSPTLLTPIVNIWIFAHSSCQFLPDHKGVRVDNLCAEIDRELNGSREISLGKLSLYSTKRYAPMTDYNGKVLTYVGKEFNTPSAGKLPPPVKRR